MDRLLRLQVTALSIRGGLTVYGLLVAICFMTAMVILNRGIAMAETGFINEEQITSTVSQLAESHEAAERSRIERCVRQVAQMWREDDGTVEEFNRFCVDNYIADPEIRRQTADRFESAFASIFGRMREMGQELSWNLDIETGPILPIDYFFAQYSPGAHFSEDMFTTKIGFMALLNYPIYSLDERLDFGPGWSREEWAQARLVEGFDTRIPAEVSQQATKAYVAADTYINQYNIYMHHLLTPDGERPFPEGMKLITHWNLRDELKAQYSAADGLARQEMIYNVMLKIVRQEIPSAVINNPAVDWKPATNEVTLSPVVDGAIPRHWKIEGAPGTVVDNSREPDTRYERLLNLFHVQQAIDPYYPAMPTMMDRRFQRDREIPEAEVERILTSVCSSPVIAEVGRVIEKRLGRKLRPYDIWYDGFKTHSSVPNEVRDSIVGEKYPTIEAFQNDMPNILRKLGFDEPTAEFLVSRIAIDPSRGAGHAAGPGMKSDKARLRTRVGARGMDYKGYNIAIHELGHNVEQVFSLNRIDHTLLRGVPNAAFTESFAFIFQSRDLELLGLKNSDPLAGYLTTLDLLWSTYEIGGVSLVDMAVWNWMYAHPDATPAQLKEAVIAAAKDVWNKYFAPIFGEKDSDLLAVYSHMISYPLYLPDYPLGHIISYQIEEHMKKGNLAQEMERMCRTGSVTPDLWMREAVGGPISVEPLLRAAMEAVQAVAN